MIKVMIVDDDVAARQRLKEMVSAYDELFPTWEAGNIKDAKQLLKQENPDLLFLDLELPDGLGTEVLDYAKQYRPKMYVVMFTAVYGKISDEAYTRGESDYLLKPIMPDELDKVIKRFLASYKKKEEDIAESEEQNKVNGVLALTTITNELRTVKFEEIGFFKYDGKRRLWFAVLDGNAELSLRKGTKAQDILNLSPRFQQSQQSYIVNLDYVDVIGSSEIRMKAPFDETVIPIGRTFHHEFAKRFNIV